MSGGRRAQLEPAWLLHHRPWSDSSRILELMSRTHGRITLFAHGARRPKSPWRSVLQPFVPLIVSWSGRADGGTLTGAELAGAPRALPRDRLLPAFYLNELLLRLLPREDRHERLYDAYEEALAALCAVPGHGALRGFERVLLEEIGYGLELGLEAGSGGAVNPEGYYHFQPGRGLYAVREAGEAREADAYLGADLLDAARGDFHRPQAESAARRIYGAAIAHCLEGRGLATRDVMLAMRRREAEA